MRLVSSAFEPGGIIPDRYTCRGENISPDLSWHEAPKETRSFALIAEDPDAPDGSFLHWTIFNIPENQMNLGADGGNGFMQGENDFGKSGYGGPCPPRGHGPHRYYFRLYALDTTLPLPNGAGKEDIERAMEGHVLADAELMGVYEIKES